MLGRFLARDLQLKYRGSSLGFFWSLLGPLFLLVVYSVVFSGFVRVQTPLPYPLFVLSGLLPWLFLARGVERSCHAILDQGPFLQKVSIPRVLLVASGIGVQLVELLLSLGLLVLAAALMGYPPTWSLAWLPLCLALHVALVFGLGLALSLGTVFFRDLLPITEIGLQVWFYLSPILYPAALAKGFRFGWLYGVNPLAALLEGYRACLFGGPAGSALEMALAFGGIGCVLAGGLSIFSRFEAVAVKEL